MQAIGQDIHHPVPKDKLRPLYDHCGSDEKSEVPVPGDLAKTNHDAQAGQSSDLRREMLRTIANLFRRWFITGWGAPHHAPNPGLLKLQSIPAVGGSCLTCQAKFIQYREEEIARTIAGEHSTCPIRPVGSGSKTKQQDLCVGIAKAGNWSCPVIFVEVGAPLLQSDFFAIAAKSGAAIASDDRLLDARKNWRQNLGWKAVHPLILDSQHGGGHKLTHSPIRKVGAPRE